MNILRTAAIFLTLGGSAAWAAADPQLLGLLMPDAKGMAGMQVTEAKASRFGQFILSQAAPAAEFDKLKAMTGFDPRTDLTEMVAGATLDGKGLVAGRGAFQPARILSLATTAGVQTENYKGISILKLDTTGGAAFLDGTTFVAGQTDNLKSAIDRWQSGARASGALTAKATEVSSTSQAWAVATGISQLLANKPASTGTVPPEAQMIQNVLSKIDQVAGGVNFGDSIVMKGQAVAASAQDAQALADVMNFVVMMASGKAPLPAVPQVSADGATVNVLLTLTADQVEKLLQPATTQQRAAVRVARK